jgi:hypothetical protein
MIRPRKQGQPVPLTTHRDRIRSTVIEFGGLMGAIELAASMRIKLVLWKMLKSAAASL